MSLVNPRTGIVRRLVRYRGEPGDAPLHIAGADVAGMSAAGGAGRTWDEAAQAAVGEACERYAAAQVPRGDLRVATARELGADAARGWTLFSPRQHAQSTMRYAAWDEDARMAWTQATRLGDGARRYVPAQFVYLPYEPLPGESLLAPSLSTGLAAAPSREEACLRAILEIVERDAFTLAWLHRATPPLAQRVPPLATRLARHGRMRLLDLTHDLGLPTYLAVLEQPTTVGVVRVVGAATRHDPAAAMDKAAIEAFQTVPYVRDLARHEPSWRAGARFENLRDFRDHARFYTMHPEHREGIAHLADGPFEPAPEREPVKGDPRELLRDALSRLTNARLDAYVVEVTPSDVAEAGIHVVRVLVPGAQPLHGFYQVPHLGSARFHDAARILPYLATARSEENVNPWPHPFA